MDLKDKVALITGSARRIGRATALELADAGAAVVVHYRSSASDAQALAERIRQGGGRALTVQGDLVDARVWPMLVEAAVREFGALDVLVNNASRFDANSPDDLGDFDPSRWEMYWRVNLLAPMGLIRAARAALAAGEGGRIVNLLDASLTSPWKDFLAYTSSKAGLAAMTRSLSKSLAPEILVNGVSPGLVEFPQGFEESARRKLLRRVPLGRAGGAESVARVIRALLESGDYVTGEIWRVDGGRYTA